MQNSKPWHLPTFDVFVGNLPADTDQKKISKYFTKHGEVQAIIVRDSNTDGKKIAYVKYLCQEDADKAVAECQNIDINGSRVMVRRADSRRKPGQDRLTKDDAGFKNKMTGQKSDQGSAMNSQQKEYLEEIIMVTHVESANSLWSQIVNEDNMQNLLEMSEQLQTICPASPKITGPTETNKVYGAVFSEDKQWYRCKFKQSFGTDRIKVLYIDYGNTEEVNPNSLVEIPVNVANIKPFAVRMVFNNIRVTDMHDRKTMAYLKKLTEGKYIRSVMKRKLSDSSGYFAEMYMDGECINDKLVEDGYASFRLEMKRHEASKAHGVGGGGGGGFGMPADREMGGGYAVNMEKGGGDSATTMSQRQVFDETGNLQISVSNSGRSTPINTDMNNIGGGGAASELRLELNSKLQELQKVKFEKEKINGELANLRSRMKVLQNEFSSVSSRMMETSVNTQFHSALELAGKVKKLRCQFPGLQKTPLDDGLELVNSENRVQTSSVKSLPEVLTALSKYRGLQKEICTLKDMTSLDSLIEARNSAREETVAILSGCIGELGALPLNERGQAVEAALAKIRKYYDSYFKFTVHSCPSLDALLPTFSEWKLKRMKEFMESREMTDSYQQATVSALSSVQSQLSFDNLENFEQKDFDLETLLRQYIQGMQHEIAVTDAERTSDAGFLAALVQSLYKELQSEMSNIENYQRLLTEFRTMKAECEPWLEKKPCTEELQGVRKMLRGLKSKLRHRVADREDLEENEEDSSELEEIKQDISAIRREIHQALGFEDKLVTDLAKIADGHFPELMKLHPEMGIDIHLEYNGLVKPSQEIEHFDLSPTEGGGQGLFSASFSGQPIFIREQLLSDGERLEKDEFVRKVASYSGIKHENLQPIKSLFFDKNARHGYVCTDRSGELLSCKLEKGSKPPKQTIQHVLRCVCKALQALHSKNIVHGEVTPQNILIREEDGAAVLLEPDFSQTMKERSRKKYVTSSGMAFVAPELKNAMLKDVFPATDMFNLGMLLLWLHYPDVQFGINADAPDFKAVPLDQSVQMTLSSLLNNLPHLRMTTDQFLSSEYLNTTIPDSEPEPRPEPRLEPRPEPRLEPRPEPRSEPRPEPQPDQHTHTVPLPSQQYDVMAEIGTFTLEGIEESPSQSQGEEHEQLNEAEKVDDSAEVQVEQVNGFADSAESIESEDLTTKTKTDDISGKCNTGEVKQIVDENSSSEKCVGADTENVNLDDVLKGFSKQNSFLKESSRPPPPLSLLLKGLDN